MSGGAFDYRDSMLVSLQDMVAREIGYYEYGSSPKDSRVLTYMKLICEDLRKLGQALHSLDWYISGDTDEESFISDYENLYMEKHDGD